VGTGVFVGPDSGVFVGFVVGAGVFVGPDLGVFVVVALFAVLVPDLRNLDRFEDIGA